MKQMNNTLTENASVSELSVSEEIEIFEALKNREKEAVSLALFEEGVRFAEALSVFSVTHLHCLPGLQLIVQAVFTPRVAGVEMLPLRKCFDAIKNELSGNARKVIDKSEVNAVYRSLSVPFFAFMRRREDQGRHGKRTDSALKVKYGKKGAKVNHSWGIDLSQISDSEKVLARTATQWCERVALEVLKRPALVCTMKGSELELIVSKGDVPEWFKAIQSLIAEMLKPSTEGVKADKAGALALVKEEALLELRRRERGACE